MTEIETIQMLENQIAAMQQQTHLYFVIIVLLILALAVTIALMYRSVPPGHIKDVMGLLSGVLRDSTNEILAKLEKQAPATEGIVDDAVAIAGRAIHKAVYPDPQTATVDALNGPSTMTAEVSLEVTTEEK